MMEDITQQDTEAKAWKELIKELKVLFPKEDINAEKFKPLIKAIDNHAQDNARLRIFQKEKGIFDNTKNDGRLFT